MKKKKCTKCEAAFTEGCIVGMEGALEMIRKNMSGGALRMFDIQSYHLVNLIQQLKKKSINNEKETK